jgi:hypothetical protein
MILRSVVVCDPILGNGKDVPTAKNTHTIVELLFQKVFSTRSVQNGYKAENWGNEFSWQEVLYWNLERRT